MSLVEKRGSQTLIRYCRRASRRRPSCTSIFKSVWYPIPLRPAISRALATSGAGNRSAICTLLVRLRPATRADPFSFWCLRNSRPAALAHHVASASWLLNFGTLVACFSFFTASKSNAANYIVCAVHRNGGRFKKAAGPHKNGVALRYIKGNNSPWRSSSHSSGR